MSNIYEEYLTNYISNDIDTSNDLFSNNEENDESINLLQKKTKNQTKEEETYKMMKFKKVDEETSGEINPEYYIIQKMKMK